MIRPNIPSRTIRVRSCDPSSTPLEELVANSGAEVVTHVSHSGGNTNTFVVCSTTDSARALFKRLIEEKYRVEYQNYYTYFRVTNVEGADPVALREGLKEALAPAQLIGFRLYRKRRDASDNTESKENRVDAPFKGDGHAVVDTIADLKNLLERGTLTVSNHEFSFRPYNFRSNPAPHTATHPYPRPNNRRDAAPAPSSEERAAVIDEQFQ